MKEILLAIDGNSPTKCTFQYAVDLCKRIKAGLRILQFIRKKQKQSCLSDTSQDIDHVEKTLELVSLGSAAFPQDVDKGIAHELSSNYSVSMKDLLPRSQKAGVPFKMFLSSGEPEKELPDYIDNHQEIVLMVLDASSHMQQHSRYNKSRKKSLGRIKKNLTVPLVIVRN